MITLTVPNNRYWGVTSTGKSYKFNLSAKGPHWYYIPISAVVDFEEREKTIEIKFDKWAFDIPKHGDQLRWAMTKIKKRNYEFEIVSGLEKEDEDEFAFL